MLFIWKIVFSYSTSLFFCMYELNKSLLSICCWSFLSSGHETRLNTCVILNRLNCVLQYIDT